MTKYCLISIRPQPAFNILNGDKTIEFRKVVLKWVLEEISKGNTVKFLLYETFGTQKYVTEELWGDKYPDWYGYEIYKNGKRLITEGRGQVVASFDVSKIEDVKLDLIDKSGYDEDKQVWFETPSLRGYKLEVMSCVSQDEMEKYFTNEVGYAIHISNLKVFDTPKELSEFQNYYPKIQDTPEWAITSSWQILHGPLERAPKNMMIVLGD